MTQQEFLNRYHYNPTTDKLGAGGFGSVFKAYDTVYDREVAIKIAPVIDGKENLSLMKEVELANKLPAHPNIVNYESCFRISGMEGAKDIGILQYYPEGSLATIIKKGNLNPTQQKQLIEGILNGLDFLHTNNVMHRDMKPGNILIAKRGDQYIPKIADFGLSRQVDSFENSSFVNSFVGGSAYYAAPEQLAGEKVRANVDLWSFGVILYELMTGDRPFTATTAKGETEDARQEVYAKIKRGALPSNIASIALPYQTTIKACLIPDRTKRVQNIRGLQKIMAGQIPTGFDFEKTVIEDQEAAKKIVSEPERRSTTSTVTSVEEKEKKSINPPSADKKEKSKLPMILGGLGLLVAIGIGVFLMLREGGEKMSEQDLWISTLSKKDTTSYITYLAAFPQGKFTNEATTQLKSLRLIVSNARKIEKEDWSKAEKANTITALQNYVNTYSDGSYVQLAQEKISVLKENQSTEEAEAQRKAIENEDKVWKRCERKKEVAVYQDYLRQFPAGRYRGKANKAIEKITLEQERKAEDARAEKARNNREAFDKWTKKGDAAYSDKKYDLAKEHYQAAASFDNNQTIKSLIAKCDKMLQELAEIPEKEKESSTTNQSSEAIAFELMQNKPNPFRTETVIGFNLPSAGKATLQIMNVNGRVLKSIERNFERGYNEILIRKQDLK